MQKEFPKNNLNRKILYLCLWMAFFIAVSIFVVVNTKKAQKLENNTVAENKVEQKDDENSVVIKKRNKTITDFEDYKKELLKLNYAFTYEVTKNEKTVTYVGKSMGSKISLTRTDNLSSKNLYIENDVLYEITNNENKLSDSDVDHENLLDTEYLFSKIIKVEANGNNTFNLTITGYNALATFEGDDLVIEINNETENYKLKYSSINKINIID